MALPTTYSTGTASVSANDTAVTGQGTTWLTSGLQAGDLFWAGGMSVRIASINSNTSLTLAFPWPGGARNNASYEVRFTPDLSRALASSRAVLDAIAGGGLYSLGSLQTAANKLPYATGSGTYGLTDFTGFARTLLSKPNAADVRKELGNVPTGDTVSVVGFIGGQSANPYLRNGGNNDLVQLQKAIGIGTGFYGIDKRVVVWGKAAGTPDASGRLVITLPVTFANADWTSIVSNGNFGIQALVGTESQSANQLTVRARDFAGNSYPTIYQVNYIGIGDVA